MIVIQVQSVDATDDFPPSESAEYRGLFYIGIDSTDGRVLGLYHATAEALQTVGPGDIIICEPLPKYNADYLLVDR